MFCYQCEQTAKGTGCEKIGVCGKDETVAALQDKLIDAVKGLSAIAHAGRKVSVIDNAIDAFTCKAIFSTLTNVNFDPERFVTLIHETAVARRSLLEKVKAAGGNVDGIEVCQCDQMGLSELVAAGEKVGVKSDPDANEDILALQQLLIYGLKGLAAYADHAAILGQTDTAVYDFVHEGMAATLDKNLGVDELVGLVLKCGEVNIRAMELLDAGNTGTYGHPVPTKVPLGVKAGKAILVSGHDLKDLAEILKLSEGKGINVYTHGEMLPCHGYPELKKYDHFYGHYGTAWQNQAKEFAAFPGAILMTTNCIQKPKESYQDNIYTTGLVGWPGVTHLENGDLSPVIEKALEMPGFAEDVEGKTIMTGFARNAVLGVADQIIEAVKGKALRHFFLVAGCDGAKPGRNYYTEFVEKVPEEI